MWFGECGPRGGIRRKIIKIPETHPVARIRTAILFAWDEIRNPNVIKIPPNIAVGRQPNRATRMLTRGPKIEKISETRIEQNDETASICTRQEEYSSHN